MLITSNVDEESIQSIHDSSFPLPQISNPAYVIKKLCIDNGELIGVGLVKIMAEGVLILDSEQPTITRAKAAQAIIEHLKEDAKLAGLSECHIFVKDPKVQEFLRHLGFQDCQGGKPMVIHF